MQSFSPAQKAGETQPDQNRQQFIPVLKQRNASKMEENLPKCCCG